MFEFWDEIATMDRRLHDIVRRVLGTRARLAVPALPLFVRRPFLPATDVYAKDGDLIVRLELPGIDPERDVKVTVDGDDLVIRGERRQEEEVEEGAYYMMEATYGAFERHVPIPEGVDEDAIGAEYANGVLQVTVPKAAQIEPPKAKEIAVNSGQPVKAA